MTKARFLTKEQMLTGDGAPRPVPTKPAWTEEEQFWRSVRRAMLELVNAIEMCKLSKHVDIPTSQIRRHLKSYQQAYMYPPIAAGDVRERIAELTAEKVVELTTQAECDKL